MVVIRHFKGLAITMSTLKSLKPRRAPQAEKVLLHFSKRNIPCYPVHDSFIMHHGYEKELDDVMKKAFLELIRKPINVKLTRLTQHQKQTMVRLITEDGSVTMGLDKLLSPSHPYASCRDRLFLWKGVSKGDLSSPLKKAPLTGFHSMVKHIAAKVVSPSSETMRTT